MARFNSERRPIIRRYFDEINDASILFDERISLDEIREFGSGIRDVPDVESIDFSTSFEELLLAIPEDLDPIDTQHYLLVRYEHIEDTLSQADGFAIHDLLSFEALVRDSVFEGVDSDVDLRQIYKPDTKEKHFDISNIKEPSNEFREKWADRISFDSKELIAEFVSRTTPTDVLADSGSLDERVRTAQSILEFLTYDPNNFGRFDFFLNPIFSIDETKLVVPFPELLITTGQYRIENHLDGFDEVQLVEDLRKGKTVEELTFQILSNIPNRNFLKNFHYFDGQIQREADGLLVLDNSVWSVEIKSHPIFRKIPHKLDIIRSRAIQIISKALEQANHTVDYVRNSDMGENLLFNVTGSSNASSLENGRIVVLDGFLPTVYSGNSMVDKVAGLDKLHQENDAEDRIFVITLYDLYQLLQQPEIGKFEDFLLWRTGYEGNHPVWGFSEREFWAFYFDIYLRGDDFEEAIDDAANRDIVTIYISERFNDKSHLGNLV